LHPDGETKITLLITIGGERESFRKGGRNEPLLSRPKDLRKPEEIKTKKGERK